MTTNGNSSDTKPAQRTKLLSILEPKLTPPASLDKPDPPALGLSPGGPASTSSSGWNAYYSNMTMDQQTFSNPVAAPTATVAAPTQPPPPSRPTTNNASVQLSPFTMKTDQVSKGTNDAQDNTNKNTSVTDDNFNDQDMSDENEQESNDQKNENDNDTTPGSMSSAEFALLPAKERRRLRRLVHPANRKRIAVACESCKRRKQRCDGDNPCGLCKTKNFECIYSKPPPDQAVQTMIPLAKSMRKRSKKIMSPAQSRVTKPKTLSGLSQSAKTTPLGEIHGSVEGSSPATPGSIVSLAGSVSSNPESEPRGPIEALQQYAELQQRPNVVAQPTTQFMAMNGSRVHESMEMAAASPEQTQSKPPQSGEPLGPPPLGITQFTEQNKIPRGKTDDYQVESLGDGRDPRLLCDATGHLRYIGESCSLSLLEQIRRLFRQRIGDSPFTEDPERYNIVDGQSFQASVVPLQLPSRVLADKLVDSFEENVQDTTYILDLPKFRRDVDGIYKSPISAPKSLLCLFHLIIALGGVYYMTPPLSINTDISLEYELERISFPGYFESGLGFLTDAVEDGDIWVVQAYLLVSLYYEVMCKRNACWIQLGVAIRYAQALGMGRKWIDLSFTPEMQLHRKRLFRSLYIHDRLKSFSLGRPLACSNDDLDSYSVSSPMCNEDEAHIEMAKLCQIIGDIWLNVYRSKTIYSSVAQSLATRLKTWSSSFETFVRDTSLAATREATPSGGDDGPSKSSKEGISDLNAQRNLSGLIDLTHKIPWNRKYLLLLNLTYLNGIILLTRPFLFYTAAKRSSYSTLDPEAVRTFEKLASTCVQSAIMSVRLVESTFYVNAQPKRSTAIVYYVFTCGVILLLKAFRAPTIESSPLSWGISGSMRILAFYSNFDPSAKRYWDILKEMSSTVSKKHFLPPNETNPIHTNTSFHVLPLARSPPPSTSAGGGPSAATANAGGPRHAFDTRGSGDGGVNANSNGTSGAAANNANSMGPLAEGVNSGWPTPTLVDFPSTLNSPQAALGGVGASPSGVSDFLPTGIDLGDLVFSGDGEMDQWVFTSSGPVIDSLLTNGGNNNSGGNSEMNHDGNGSVGGGVVSQDGDGCNGTGKSNLRGPSGSNTNGNSNNGRSIIGGTGAGGGPPGPTGSGGQQQPLDYLSPEFDTIHGFMMHSGY